MKTYMIGYDLNKSGQDYDKLIKEIQNLTTSWWHCLDSTWLIKSNLTEVQIATHLKNFMDTNDELLVAAIDKNAAWVGFNKECSDWLKDNL